MQAALVSPLGSKLCKMKFNMYYFPSSKTPIEIKTKRVARKEKHHRERKVCSRERIIEEIGKIGNKRR